MSAEADLIEGVHVAPMSPELEGKMARLRRDLRSMERVIVAYSGGVDSAFLLKVAHAELGDEARAFTARSPSLMQMELEEAKSLAERIGVHHQIVETHELERAGYVENSASRCYHCKTELFTATEAYQSLFEGSVVVDGFNQDDLGDFRPGHRAASEHSVRHPLAEAGLFKAEIRALSRALDLPTWKKPQLACLSSRIPHGTEVTEARLQRVESVEVALRGLGFFDVRARLVSDNDDMVRLEVGEAELSRALELRASIVEAAHAANFRFVTLDLEGFRSGRMSEQLVQLGRGRSAGPS